VNALAEPIMLRARITDAEYHALKVRAAQDRRPVADLVADALRAAYPITPKEPK